jgi:hypothetical protein
MDKGGVGVRTVDGAGRALGLLVFIVGVLLLVGVFYLAYRELVPVGALAGSTSAASSQNAWFGIVAKGIFLFVAGFVASAIANKGIGLYQAAVRLAE